MYIIQPSHPCPACGYCPHCGRRQYAQPYTPAQPYVPYMPSYPWGEITWGGSSGLNTAGGNVTTWSGVQAWN